MILSPYEIDTAKRLAQRIYKESRRLGLKDTLESNRGIEAEAEGYCAELAAAKTLGVRPALEGGHWNDPDLIIHGIGIEVKKTTPGYETVMIPAKLFRNRKKLARIHVLLFMERLAHNEYNPLGVISPKRYRLEARDTDGRYGKLAVLDKDRLAPYDRLVAWLEQYGRGMI